MKILKSEDFLTVDMEYDVTQQIPRRSSASVL